MRISFDLDDTLIPSREMSAELLPEAARLILREPLRAGTCALLRDLQAAGHELAIYTTSLRQPIRVRWAFRVLGVHLAAAINQVAHERRMRSEPADRRTLSKYPPAFGIDLHIDDSPGVAMEGTMHGFAVVRVDPMDPRWDDVVREAALR